MTFECFVNLVKSHYPEAVVTLYEFKRLDRTSEGWYIDRRVGVKFHQHGKEHGYQYEGSYCDLLNEIGIPTVYRSEILEAERLAEEYEREPVRVVFGVVRDNAEKAREWRARVENYKKNFHIIEG